MHGIIIWYGIVWYGMHGMVSKFSIVLNLFDSTRH
jgi:hypothetical protein